MSFEGKGSLVTGAGSGIGRTVAQRLASLGSRVVVSDLSEDGGRETVELIESAGGAARFVQTDVSDADSVEELFAQAVGYLDALDYAVNNAGIAHHPGDLHELPIEDWDRVIAVDLRGTFLCMRKELGLMVGAGHGVIVNMASNAGLKNAPAMAGYTAAKHGVVGLTKNTALQYARRNIRINAVCPGTILTPGLASYPDEIKQGWADLIPNGRTGTVEEVADAVEFLLSDKSSFITGVPLLVDGGLMYA
jgi:NAD(P)-dependent dehydrogenase (short-subunit alcohol dehydrogenase family)